MSLGLSQARADETSGRVRVGGWTAPVRGRSGLDLATQVELSPRVRLEAFAARSGGEGGEADFGWARVDLGSVRVAGGVSGRDGGVHVGWAPAGRLELGGGFAVEGGVDLSLGAGFLGRDRRTRTGRHRDLWPGPVDLWAAGLAARVELQWAPCERLLLGAGVHGAATVVGAPPVAGSPPPALTGLAREVDLDLLGALSQAELGAWGRVELRAWRGELLAAPATLHLGYLEAWEQVHLDGLTGALRLADPDLGLGPVPWRVTRSGQLTLRWGSERRRLELGLDLRHVQGSTTLERFEDRDGWSVGGRMALRWDRLLCDVTARHALAAADVEAVVGRLARTRVAARAGLIVYESTGLAVKLDAGVEAGLTDGLGLPRQGLAFLGGLTVELGAPTRPFCDPRRDPFALAARAAGRVGGVPPADPLLATVAEAEPELDLERVDALLDRFTPEQLARALGVELPPPDQIERFLADHARQIARLDQDLPGAGDLIRRAAADLRAEADDPARTATPSGTALAIGHGLGGARAALLSASQRGRALEALTVRLDAHAPSSLGEAEQAIQVDDYAGFSDYRAREGLEKWTILRPGSRDPWLQGQSAWSRAMHRFVTGR